MTGNVHFHQPRFLTGMQIFQQIAKMHALYRSIGISMGYHSYARSYERITASMHPKLGIISEAAMQVDAYVQEWERELASREDDLLEVLRSHR